MSTHLNKKHHVLCSLVNKRVHLFFVAWLKIHTNKNFSRMTEVICIRYLYGVSPDQRNPEWFLQLRQWWLSTCLADIISFSIQVSFVTIHSLSLCSRPLIHWCCTLFVRRAPDIYIFSLKFFHIHYLMKIRLAQHALNFIDL